VGSQHDKEKVEKKNIRWKKDKPKNKSRTPLPQKTGLALKGGWGSQKRAVKPARKNFLQKGHGFLNLSSGGKGTNFFRFPRSSEPPIRPKAKAGIIGSKGRT